MQYHTGVENLNQYIIYMSTCCHHKTHRFIGKMKFES